MEMEYKENIIGSRKGVKRKKKSYGRQKNPNLRCQVQVKTEKTAHLKHKGKSTVLKNYLDKCYSEIKHSKQVGGKMERVTRQTSAEMQLSP